MEKESNSKKEGIVGLVKEHPGGKIRAKYGFILRLGEDEFPTSPPLIPEGESYSVYHCLKEEFTKREASRVINLFKPLRRSLRKYPYWLHYLYKEDGLCGLGDDEIAWKFRMTVFET